MSEVGGLREYRQGDDVRLTAELRDPNGVTDAGVIAFLEGGDDHSDPGSVRPEHRLSIDGWPEEPTDRAEIVMRGTVGQQKPGVYVCYAVVAGNRYDALSRHDLDPPMRFRIVEHPDDVREGPEVLSVGDFW